LASVGRSVGSQECVQCMNLGEFQQPVRPWTKDCAIDIAKLELDISEVAVLAAEAVSHGRFQGSVWCTQSPDGPSAICDAYVLKRKEWNNAAKKELDCEYYVKLAIGRSGAVLLLVSCHT